MWYDSRNDGKWNTSGFIQKNERNKNYNIFKNMYLNHIKCQFDLTDFILVIHMTWFICFAYIAVLIRQYL